MNRKKFAWILVGVGLGLGLCLGLFLVTGFSENRIEKFGWMDKNRELKFIKLIDGTIGIEGVFPLKENISEWEDTWPPKKVKITVEEVKE